MTLQKSDDTTARRLHPTLWYAGIFYILLIAVLAARLEKRLPENATSTPEPNIQSTQENPSAVSSQSSNAGHTRDKNVSDERATVNAATRHAARVTVTSYGVSALWILFGILAAYRLIPAFFPKQSGLGRRFRKPWHDAPAWAVIGAMVLLKISGLMNSVLSDPTKTAGIFKLGARYYDITRGVSVTLWLIPTLWAFGGMGASPKPKTAPSSAYRPIGFVSGAILFMLAWLALWLIWPDVTAIMHRMAIYPSHDGVLLGFWLPGIAILYLISAFSRAGLSLWRGRLALGLRWVAFTVLFLALSDPRKMDIQQDVTVVYALDVSDSIPEDIQQRALQFIRESARSRAPGDQAALIVFAGDAQVERSRDYRFDISRRLDTDTRSLYPNATNISNALNVAKTLFPTGGRRRIVLLTDGNQTKGDMIRSASEIAADNIALDVVPLKAAIHREIVADKIVLGADILNPGETFDLDVLIDTFRDCAADVNLFQNGELLATRSNVMLKSPRTRVTFNGIKTPPDTSMMKFQATVIPHDPTTDTLPDNNSAYAAALVKTNLDILILTDDMSSVESLVTQLRKEGRTVALREPGGLPTPFELMYTYDCIILAGIDRYDLGSEREVAIEKAVRDYGVGLIMIGGLNSFGAGGYIGSPVERVLPVSCDVEDSKVLSNGALVVILHTCEFTAGNTWAKIITRTALDELTAGDYFGVAYFGFQGGDSWLFKPMRCTDKNIKTMRDLIKKATPSDMPDYDPTLRMAADELEALGNKASVDHIIIISDGDASAPSAQTIARLQKLKCSVTSIAINPHGGYERATMKSIARRTHGKYMLVNDPKKLPKIFAREARVVRRSLIYENPDGIPITLHRGKDVDGLLNGIDSLPPVTGLVVTSERHAPLVNTLATARVGNLDTPILAERRCGNGKTVAFTSDAARRWTKTWVTGWPEFSAFWSQIVSKVKRDRIRQNVSVEVNRLPDKDEIAVAVTVMDETPGKTATVKGTIMTPSGEEQSITFHEDAGRFIYSGDLNETGSYVIGVQVVDENGSTPAPVLQTFSYNSSLEFKRLTANMPDLTTLAGKSISARHTPLSLQSDPSRAGFFERNILARKSARSLFSLFAVAALIIFFFDIFFRRVFLDVDRVANRIALLILKLIPGSAAARNELRRKLDTERAAMQHARKKIDEGLQHSVYAQRQALHDALANVDASTFTFRDAEPGQAVNLRKNEDRDEPRDDQPGDRSRTDAPQKTDGDRPDDDAFNRLLKAKRRRRQSDS